MDSCLRKNSAKKVTSRFSKIRALNGLISKTYYICHPIFSWTNLKFFNVWLFDYSAYTNFNVLRADSFSNFLWPDKFFGELLTKLGKHQFLCLPNSVQVLVKNYS